MKHDLGVWMHGTRICACLKVSDECVRREGRCMHLADALADGILHADTSEKLVDPLDNTLDD